MHVLYWPMMQMKMFWTNVHYVRLFTYILFYVPPALRNVKLCGFTWPKMKPNKIIIITRPVVQIDFTDYQ